MKKISSKILTIIISVLVVGTGGYYAYKKHTSQSTTVSSTKYSLGKVTRTNLDITVQATGTVTGSDAVNVFSFNTGVIQGMAAKKGDYVKKDDLFCKIDDITTQQAVESAKTTVEHTKLELQALENQMDSFWVTAPIDGKIKAVYVSAGDDIASVKSTYGGMAMMTVGTDNAFETAVPFPSSGKVAEVCTTAGQSVKKGDVLFKLDAKSLNNSIATKKNELRQAEDNLSNKEQDLAKSTITTPISGIVSVLDVKNGEIVDNSKLMATITDTSKMEVTLPIDELDINKIKIGQVATIKISDIDGKNFTGKVESIAQSGTTTNNVTTYDVVVSIDNPDNVKIGMNANVTIAIQSKENVLTVPVEAITEKNGKKYVMVSEVGQTPPSSSKQASNNVAGGKLVEVQTGIKNKTLIEIISGVTENQVVMTQLPESTSTNKSNQGGMSGAGMGGPPPGM